MFNDHMPGMLSSLLRLILQKGISAWASERCCVRTEWEMGGCSLAGPVGASQDGPQSVLCHNYKKKYSSHILILGRKKSSKGGKGGVKP